MAYPTTVDVQELINRSQVSPMQRRALIICIVFAIIDGFDALIIGFVVPALADDWGRSAASLTPVTLAGLIGTIIGTLLIAPLADRFGRRPVILAGTAVFAVLTLAAAAAPNVAVLLVLRFIAGLGLGAVPAVLLAYGSEIAPQRMRATIITVVGSGLAAGGFIGGFVASFLIPAFGWRSVFIAGGVLPLLAMIAALRWLPESPQYLVTQGRHREAAPQVAQIADVDKYAPETVFTVGAGGDEGKVHVRELFEEGRGRKTVVLWVLYLAGFMTTFFIFSWLPSVLTEAGIGDTAALIATSVCTLGGMIGGVVLGRMVDRTGARFKVVAISYLVGAIAVATTAVATGSSLVILFIALFVVGSCTIGTGICVNSLTTALYPARVRSTGVGWAYGFGRLGSVVGPAIGGVLLALHASASTIFLLIMVPIAVCLIAVVTLAAMSRRAADIEDRQAVGAAV